MTTRRLALPLVALLALAACEPEPAPDTTPPDAPRLAPLPAVTSHATIAIRGTAEPSAEVLVTGGEEGSQLVIADAFTAAFEVTVTLTPDSDNVLSVQARDVAGNDGAATHVTVAHEAATLARLDVALDRVDVDADDGRLRVTVVGHEDEAGVPVEGLEAALTVTHAGGASEETVVLDVDGRATFVVEGLRAAGQGEVTVAGGEAVAQTLPFTVHAGAPALATLGLAVEGGAGMPSTPLVPRTMLEATLEAEDAWGNPVPPAPLCTLDSPTGLVAGLSIDVGTTPGNWTVRCQVLGSTLVADQAVAVTHGPVAHLALEAVPPSPWTAGQKVLLYPSTADAWGNPTPTSPPVTLSADPAPTGPGLEDAGAEDGHWSLIASGPLGAITVSASHPDLGDTPGAVVTGELVAGDAVTLTVGLSEVGSLDAPADALTVAAGTDVALAVTAIDAVGHPAASGWTLTTDAPGLLAGTTLSGLTTPGVYSVTATAEGGALVSTATLEVTPGAPASIDVTLSSGSVAAGEPVNVEMLARDAFGNAIPTAPATFVLVEPIAAPDAPVVGGAVTVESPPGIYTVLATLTGAPEIVGSATFTVEAGPPAELTLTLDGGDGPSDALTVPPNTAVDAAVALADAFGNPLPTADVLLTTDAPGLLEGAQLTGVTAVGTYTVVASVPGLAAPTTATVVVAPGPPAQLTAGLVSDATQADVAVPFTVALADAWGNALDASGVAVAVEPAPALPVEPVQGGAVRVRSPAGAYTVRFTVPDAPELEALSPLDVSPGPVSGFDLTLAAGETFGDALSVTAGTPVTLEVTAEDAWGNPLDTPVQLSTDAPGVIVGDTLGGVTAAGDYTVAAALLGAGGASASASLKVEPGPVAALAFELEASETAAGDGLSGAWAAADAFGNPVALEAGDVVATVDGPLGHDAAVDTGGPSDAVWTATSPAGQYTARVALAESVSVQAAVVFDVVPAALSVFEVHVVDADAVGDAPAESVTVEAGASVAITVVREDAYGNLVDAAFLLDSDAPGPIVGGQLQGLDVAGSYTVVASALTGGLTASAGVVVTPGPVAAMSAELDRYAVVAGEPVEVSVEVQDAFGNAFPDEDVVVTVVQPVAAPAQPVSGDTVTIAAPVGDYTVRVEVGEGSGVATNLPLTVGPAAAATVAVTLEDAAAPEGAPDDAVAVTPGATVVAAIVAQDAYGNAVPADTLSVTSDAPGAVTTSGSTVVVQGVVQAGTWHLSAEVDGVEAVGTMTVLPGEPTAVDVMLAAASTAAGEALLWEAMATDTYGNVIPGAAFQVTVGEAVSAPAKPVEASGLAEGTVQVDSPVGTFTVEAALDVEPGEPGEGLAGVATFEVEAGPPVAEGFSFALTSVDATPGGDLDVGAGQSVAFEYGVADAFGNAIPGAVVDVLASAPGALVVDDAQGSGTVLGLTVPGDYTVLANVRGTALTTVVPFTVQPGAAASVQLVLGTNLVPEGTAVPVFFTVADAFGNALPDGLIALDITDPAATTSGDALAAVDGDTVTFQTPGTWSVTATHLASAESSTQFVTVTQLVDFQAPTVTISAPAATGSLSPGAIVDVVVDVADAGGVNRVGLLATGALEADLAQFLPPGTTVDEVSFTLTIPGSKYGPIALVAYAEDQAGNTASSEPVTIFSDLDTAITCPACTSFELMAAGYTEGSVFPTGAEGGVRAPQELVVTPSGDVLVAMDDNVRLQQTNSSFGTEQIESYMALVEGSGSVLPYALLTAEFNIPDQNVLGLAQDPDTAVVYATLGNDKSGNDTARIVSFAPSGVVTDPYFDYTATVGFREVGLTVASGRVFGVHRELTSSGVFVVDDPAEPAVDLMDHPNASAWDVCVTGGKVFMTRANGIDVCDLTLGAPSSCGAKSNLVTGGAHFTGALRACAVSPSGRLVVANASTSEVVSVDPDDANDVVVLVDAIPLPIGVAFDAQSGAMVVSSDSLDALWRFEGDF